jgi:hypothetical protein
MNLTKEEIIAIADRLDDILSNNFHDAIWNTLDNRESDYDMEVSDEDVRKIKDELKRTL